MKAVVIATDYVKDINGEFKVLEMNTNTAIMFTNANDYLDLDGLEQFVSDNGIINIEIITPKSSIGNSIDTEHVEVTGSSNIQSVSSAIHSLFESSSVNVETHYTAVNSTTVPVIEDNDTTLVIRLSYDATALIDSVYCTDNFEFLKLMHDTDTNSIPKTFINHTELGFDSIGNIVGDNGGYPNYLIKERFPTTNYEQYPKVLKIANIEELTSIKSNLSSNELLQEYVINTSDTFEGKLKTYRVISLVYGSNLDILDLTHPFVHTNACAIGDSADFDENGELQYWERVCYLQKYTNKTVESSFRYQFDDESKIIMPDGSISNVDTIQSGSVLKTLNFPDMPLDEADSGSVSSWTKSFTDLSNGMEVTTTTVVEYTSINKTLWLVNLELSNGAKFADISFGKAISKIGEQTEYRFNQFHQLTIGDSILLFNNETNSVEESIISNIQYSYEKINVYSVDVEPLDYILTTEEGVTIPKYAIFQHNPAPSSCQAVCCAGWSNIWSYPQCVGLDTGYCYSSGTNEWCLENGYGMPSGCYGCVHACASCGGGFAPK
jgi:hypothetical protein